jgi:23S rRNA (guanosine2251-2'-O)-methyltransferase
VRSAPVAFVDLNDLVRSEEGASRLLLVDDLKDPHNLGAVLRTAAALSVDGVVIAGPSAPPLGGAVAKAAAGMLGRVPLARAQVAADALVQLRDRGYWAFAADAAGTPLGEVRRSERWVLCVGAEERGLRAKTRSEVDEFVAIPMAEGVESLNLSVSAGILLWELSKNIDS